ncbi:MAG: PaaI family thioesterase [Bacteroidetes bacterium HGW-Bacteroidetes-15]|nr:MAG: PaaI family thioesterase [Bacteroidetes bacterium HGW-Bacteroidetes-15]
MKPIKNPYYGQENYNCIGCSPDNPIGINLKFFLDEDNQAVVSEWEPNINFQGFHNVLHGGIQATLLDEIASWVVYTILKSGGVTSQMNIRYHKPVLISKGAIKLIARVDKQQKRLADIKTELYDADGVLCTEAIVQYFVYPEQIAKEKFGYPGAESFL